MKQKFKAHFNHIFILVPMVVLIIIFQNCSPGSIKFSSLGEVGQNDAYVAPVTRTLNVSPITDKVTQIEPLQVLIVVDDSLTMAASQQNLARSVSQLSDLLKEIDCDIMVTTTSSESFKKPYVSNRETDATRIITTVKSDFTAADSAKFKISRTESLQSRTTKFENLANYIRTRGIQGSTKESPLATIAYALEDSTFFKPQGNALIYVITDEDDVESNQIFKNSLLAKKVTIEGLPTTVIDPVFQIPGVRRSGQWYEGQVIDPDSGYEVCRIIDDIGTLDCRTEYSFTTEKFLTLSACNAKTSICNFRELQTGIELLNGRTVAQTCQDLRNIFGIGLTTCVAESYIGGGPRQVSGTVFSEDSSYFAKADKFPGNMQAGIASKLTELFGGNYLIAAQVNLPNQTCIYDSSVVLDSNGLPPGQSFDLAFSKFENLVPQGRFLKSSICDSSAVSGQVIEQITTRLTFNITNRYSIKLDESERILKIEAVKGSNRISLQENDDYYFSNGILNLNKLNPADFDYLEVGLGLKENWGRKVSGQ